MPELRQLRAFLAVAEELSFTRAAERLHLGQQAVSKTVRQLERELGVELFERTTREVRLTPAGATLLEAGRTALLAVDDAFAAAQEVGLGRSGAVRIGVSPAIGPLERGEIVRVLRDGTQDLSIALLDVRPGDVARALRAREVDLVVARTGGARPGLESASLRPAPAVLCVPAGHRLATATSARLAQLDGERLLTWSPPGTPFTDLLLARVAATGAHIEPVEARVTGEHSLVELVERQAVALVPVGYPDVAGVRQVPLEDDVTLPLLLIWPAGPPPPAVQRLRAAMARPG